MSPMTRLSTTADCIAIISRKKKGLDGLTARMRLAFLCLLCLIPFVKIIAQSDQIPVFPIATDATSFRLLPMDSLQVLEDSTGKLTFEQASTVPGINQFHVCRDDGFNFSVHTYWFRFRLKNMMDHDAKICLESDAQYCDFYVQDQPGSWQHFTIGADVPWSKKAGLKGVSAVPLVLKQGEEILVYRKDRNNSSFKRLKYFQTAIGFTDDVIKRQYIERTNGYRF